MPGKISIKTAGTPMIDPIPTTPIFSNDKLPGAESFDVAAIALDSEPDINSGMDALQAKVRAVAETIRDPAERAGVEKAIREQALPKLMQSFTTAGITKSGWNRPSTIGEYGE